MSEELIREVDEEVKRDKLQQQLKRYGPFVVAGVVMVAAGAGGGVFWADQQEQKRLALGDQFGAAIVLAEQGNLDEAFQAFAALAEEGSGGYRMLAKIRQAALAVEFGDTETAIRLYREVADQKGLASEFRDMATVLGGMLEADDGDPAELAARLAPLTAEDNAWRFSARELTAVLAIRQGDADGAAEILRGLAGDVSAPPGVRARSSELLAAIGR